MKRYVRAVEIPQMVGDKYRIERNPYHGFVGYYPYIVWVFDNKGFRIDKETGKRMRYVGVEETTRKAKNLIRKDMADPRSDYMTGVSSAQRQELEKWFNSLDYTTQVEFYSSLWYREGRNAYEKMLEFIDYVKSGRKPDWARSMDLSDKEFNDMTNYSGLF